MNKSDISSTLKRLLFERNLKPVDLARLTNVPQPTIQRLVAGTSAHPHEKSLLPIARYFDISVEQLRGEQPIVNTSQTEKTLLEVGVKLVTVLNWEDVQEWQEHPAERRACRPTIATNSNVTHDSFALTIKDGSMEPLFPEGTTVIFNPETDAKDRHYVLVMLKNHKEPIFRQLRLDTQHRFIKPLSPDFEHFRMHLLSSDDKIIATLVEAKQQFSN